MIEISEELLARALVQEASIFLLDEPLNALDAETQEVVQRILTEESVRGGCVLAAHHDPGSLARCFSRTIQLRDGRLDHVTQPNTLQNLNPSYTRNGLPS